MPHVVEQQDVYLAHFRDMEARLARQGPEWLHRIRREAIECFAELGFPTTRSEEWKYTNVAPIAKIPFQLASETSSLNALKAIAALFPAESEEHRVVFVNGQFCGPLSQAGELPPGVQAESLAAALQGSNSSLDGHLARFADYRRHPFIALNTAFWQDGAYVRLPKGTILEKPLHLMFLSTGGPAPVIAHPRTLILAERDTQATIVESYGGLPGQTYFANAVTEIVAGDNAVVDHYKLQTENESSYHVATLQVHQERSATFSSCSVSFGGALVRNEVNAVLDAAGADCTLNGLYLARGTQHVDNHTAMDHAKPHGASRQLYSGILDGHSTGVFNGRILVRPDAQKTDAIQRNRNLLLSEDAVIDTKPQLEIFANDVRCTHGATIGQIDPEALFYLCSRGIGRQEARNLLIYAFAADILERIRPRPVRAWVEDALRARLSPEATV